MTLERDALCAIANLLGGPVPDYYSAEEKLEIYIRRTRVATAIIRTVVIYSAAIPLPPSKLEVLEGV
jgi:hypothetical protein